MAKRGKTIRVTVKDTSDGSYSQRDFQRKNDALVYILEWVQTQLDFRGEGAISYTIERY